MLSESARPITDRCRVTDAGMQHTGDRCTADLGSAPLDQDVGKSTDCSLSWELVARMTRRATTSYSLTAREVYPRCDLVQCDFSTNFLPDRWIVRGCNLYAAVTCNPESFVQVFKIICTTFSGLQSEVKTVRSVP